MENLKHYEFKHMFYSPKLDEIALVNYFCIRIFIRKNKIFGLYMNPMDTIKFDETFSEYLGEV